MPRGVYPRKSGKMGVVKALSSITTKKRSLVHKVDPMAVMPFTVVQCWPYQIVVKTLVVGHKTVNVGLEIENLEQGRIVHEWELANEQER